MARNYRIAVALILSFVVFLLSACGKAGIRYDTSRSEKKYPVITTIETKPAEHFYAMTTAAPEKVNDYLKEAYKGSSETIGYVMSLHFPEHQQYETERDNEYYWITLHDQKGKLTGYRVVSVNAKTGNVDGLINGPCKVDWQALAGYTSPDDPLYLYREGLNYYAIIGDKAYCLNPEIGGGVQATDSFLPFQEAITVDIFGGV